MAVEFIQALILTTRQSDALLTFYEALGLSLEAEDHGEGPVHWSCEIGAAHFAIFEGTEGQAPKRHEGGGTMIGFRVDSLDAALARLEPLEIRMIYPPHDAPWGRRAVVLDPDGRAVELNETPVQTHAD
ncbi:MAG: VOC family protein [bacterium]